MPTGYTAQLEQHWDVNRWLRQEVVRALGVCVMLRDSGDMTDKQILESLKPKNEESYYAESVKAAHERLKYLRALTRAEWKAKYTMDLEEAIQDFRQEKERASEKESKFRKVITQIQAFQKNAKSEAGRRVAEFALEQINMVKSEFEPSVHSREALIKLSNMSVSEYTKKTIAECRRSLAFSKKELEGEKRRNKDRLKYYEDLLKDCDAFFKK